MISFANRDGVIWFNGSYRSWTESNIHVLNHGLHYASCVFEGIRVYDKKIFKLHEHIQRLFKSAELLDLNISYEIDKIININLELIDGKLSINDLEKNAITRLRKEPDEVEELEETEEEVNDDFEKLYKGQVSKSGVAVLPSKRTRRAPDQKSTSNLAREALSELKAEQPEIKEENLEQPLELKEEVKKPEEK